MGNVWVDAQEGAHHVDRTQFSIERV